MKSKMLTCITAMTLLTALAFPVSLAAQHNRHNKNGNFITFDDPNEGTGAGQGIIPYGINPLGAIIGWYVDSNNVNHGFLRAPDGTITSFDAPGAGTGSGQGTIAYGMNTWGVIVGISTDNGGVVHGFVRDIWGKITIFDCRDGLFPRY